MREQRKRDREMQIIQAAARLFARKGFSGTVMSEVAEQAGIGKGTIYEYFSSKEDLFFAVFEWFTGEIGAAAMVRISALRGSTSDRLRALSESLMGSWGEIRELFSLVFEFWAASASSQMRERFMQAFRQSYDEFRLIVSSLIEEGIERGEFHSDVDSRSVASALVGTWDALYLQAWFEEEFDLVTTARDFLEVVIKGLKGERDGQ